MRKLLILIVLSVALQAAETSGLERAHELYQRTEYRAALQVLNRTADREVPVLLLMGKCLFMQGEYKKASDVLEQAVQRAPNQSDAHLWLGRAYGRRAETSSFLTAPGLAVKARASFERALALNPGGREAGGDLLDYYLGAPGFLGGGVDKARALAEKTRETDPAEYHYRLAQIAIKMKDPQAAEEHFGRALEIEPSQLGRITALAQFLAKQGRYPESDALFRQAEQVAPASPKLLFERAKCYVEAGRNLDAARDLLARYLKSPLSPDDPPRSEAEQLLKKTGRN